jgi:endoglucanase
MPRLRRPGGTAGLVLVLLATLFVVSCQSHDSHRTANRTALVGVRRFLHDYVAPSGAVVRRDQGGDTVSEGQGYALLLAYAAADRPLFTKVWAWTRTHLQLPDGLFSFHWQAGTVIGKDPAADADTQIAWALALAGHAWSQPSYTAAARRIALAVAANEIGYDDQGRPTLAAGPWATTHGSPIQVEPGYWAFPAYAALSALTGDRRWQALTTADAAHLRAVTSDGAALPPDWATMGNGAAPAPASSPSTGTPPGSGQDGLRALVWATCLPATHQLAARWWHLIESTARVGPFTRSLQGTPVATGRSPLSLVAAAATAKVAGDAAAVSSLLARADRAASSTPTYYGEAWDALGHVLLTTNLLPGCSP